MVFSQIRTEQAKDVLNQAKMRGIETHVLREDGDWTTLQFTSHYSKLSFDEMARQMGVGIHGDGPTIQMMDALDAVSEGANPNKVLGLLYESGFTRGMVNAYARGPFKYVCASESCGVSIPSYRGRYPQSCPACGGGLLTAEQWEQRRVRRESAARRKVKESVADDVADAADSAYDQLRDKGSRNLDAQDVWEVVSEICSRGGSRFQNLIAKVYKATRDQLKRNGYRVQESVGEDI